MTRNRLIGTIAFMMVSATMFSASAIIGVGVHYGYDNSLSMKSIYGEQTTFDNLQLTIEPSWGTAPSQYQNAGTIKGSDIPILIDRSGWARHPFDLGGKVYIDIIPFLDAIEVSANYAMWEYEGKIAYPTSITFKSTQPSDPAAPFIDRINVQYDTTALTFDGLGLSNPFIHNTPYARLNFDLTVRKYIIQFPPVLKTLKLYGGAGFSLSFATPALSSGLIMNALGDTLNKTYNLANLGQNVFGNIDVMKLVGEEFFKELFTPHSGMHILLGAMVKIPILPLGIYADGKFMIPFDKPDANVELGGAGLFVDGGVALTF